MKELESLRSYEWGRDAHRTNLEEMLMKNHGLRPFVVTRSRALLAAIALLIVGAASTAAVYEWKGMTITSTDYDDGSTRIEITKDGKKIVDHVVQPDEGAMVTDDGDLIIVVPDDEDDEEDEDDARNDGADDR